MMLKIVIKKFWRIYCMICSNHAMPIRIKLGDERFVALNVSNNYKGNRKYFDSLVKVLEDSATASSYMDYLPLKINEKRKTVIIV
ncbi:hypothetical protein C1646_708602 [Rhizophagus diaphanus]|nr:hypothetical protein C1646_708602 [Rhizophagus diaphanus] [Rhizophagus sp. MUCL 43196]